MISLNNILKVTVSLSLAMSLSSCFGFMNSAKNDAELYSQNDIEIAKTIEPDILGLRNNTYVIVIGDNFNNSITSSIPKLNYAENDAKYISEIISDPKFGAVPKENVITLLGTQATAFNIKTTLAKLIVKAKPSDSVFIFYSGHGAPKIAKDGSIEDAFLITNESDPGSELSLEYTSLKLSELKKLVEKIPSKNVLVAIDACFTGQEKSMMPQGSKPLIVTRNQSLIPSIENNNKDEKVFIMSSSSTQKSFEDKDLNHGIFTYYLAEGLKGFADRNKDAEVDVNELYSYVKNKVIDKSVSLKGELQEPQILGRDNFKISKNIAVTVEKTRYIQNDRVKKLTEAYNKGYISAQQFDRAFNEIQNVNKSRALKDFIEGNLSAEAFGRAY